MLLLIFIGLLISKTHEDFYYYHADRSDCINTKPICSTKEIIVKKSDNFLILIDKKKLQ